MSRAETLSETMCLEEYVARVLSAVHMLIGLRRQVIEVLVVPPPPGENTRALGFTSRTESHFIPGTRVQRRRYVVIRESTPDQEGFAALYDRLTAVHEHYLTDLGPS